ncbi:MAG: polysaccharide biosynthesis protein [Epsilonproteobacteria bacterium]|nr:UDP-N-acetylglucosamine 4,6-dehydratase [Campylobacterota bacterium]NPA56422.1 polysaccharide biosynthesis protein [Campylobacterota bacterium]
MPFHSLLIATTWKRILFFLIGDLLLSLLSLYLAYLFRFNFTIPQEFLETFWRLYLLAVGAKLLFLALLGLYNFPWRFFGIYEAKRTVVAITLAYLTVALLLWLFYDLFLPFPRSVLFIDYFLSLFFLSSLRALKRVILERTRGIPGREAMVYGLTQEGRQLVDRSLSGELDYKIVAVIDGEGRAGSSLSGIPIISPEEALDSPPADTLIMAAELSPQELNGIVEKFRERGVTHFKQSSLKEVHDIEIEDLLARKPKDLDRERIAQFVRGKRILITGAGGSIGSELVRQSLNFGAEQVVAVEMSEYNLYRLTEEYPSVEPILCDVTEREDFERVVERYRPDVILHAAAYKHVPLAELNPRSAVRNNILGTRVVIDTALSHGVPHIVLISTDKAVNPTNVMGASKRVCELYAQNVPSGRTVISAVRFGNVLGSSGSVIPKFKEQILSGGPVTVTHPEIRRYFMLTSEACQLVLQAASLAQGQEIFILDMGEPVKIVDLARKMMELYGKKVDIEFIGLRPGEKLYEELLIEGAEKETKYNSIYIAKASKIDFDLLERRIERLLTLVDYDEIVEALQEIVEEYSPAHSPRRGG